MWEGEREREVLQGERGREKESVPHRVRESYSRDLVLAMEELLCTCYMSTKDWSMENKAASQKKPQMWASSLSLKRSDRPTYTDTPTLTQTQTHLLPGATACPLSREGLMRSCSLCLSFLSLFSVRTSEFMSWNSWCSNVCVLSHRFNLLIFPLPHKSLHSEFSVDV